MESDPSMDPYRQESSVSFKVVVAGVSSMATRLRGDDNDAAGDGDGDGDDGGDDDELEIVKEALPSPVQREPLPSPAKKESTLRGTSAMVDEAAAVAAAIEKDGAPPSLSDAEILGRECGSPAKIIQVDESRGKGSESTDDLMVKNQEELFRVAGIGEEAMVSNSVQTARERKPLRTQNQVLAGEPAMVASKDVKHSDSEVQMLSKPRLFLGEEDMATPKEQEETLEDLPAGEPHNRSFAMDSESRTLSISPAELGTKNSAREPTGASFEGESEAVCTNNIIPSTTMQAEILASEISPSPIPAASNLTSREEGEQAGKTMVEADDSHGDELQEDLQPLVAMASSAVPYPNGSEITEGKQDYVKADDNAHAENAAGKEKSSAGMNLHLIMTGLAIAAVGVGLASLSRCR